MSGCKGEDYTDDHVWVVKTCHPIRMPGSKPYFANKCVIGVRNPLDVFPSQVARINTFTHSVALEFNVQEENPLWWDWFVRKEAGAWNKFYEVVRSHIGQTPTYFVRYEDLILDPEGTMKGLYAFLLSAPDLIGTNCERRIADVVEQGQAATTIYKLKKTTGRLNVHLQKYTEDQLDFLKTELADNLAYFGYTDCKKDNPTSFFALSDEEKTATEITHNQFKVDNVTAINEVSSCDYVPREYGAYVGPDTFPMFNNDDDMKKLYTPGLLHA